MDLSCIIKMEIFEIGADYQRICGMEDINNVDKLIELMKADGNEDLVTDMRRTKSYL